jgi:hypothetical protein
MDENTFAQAIQIACDALNGLNQKNRDQLRGTAFLYRLCQQLNLVEDKNWGQLQL